MERTFDDCKEANQMKVKVDRRHLQRGLACVLDGHAIAELIKTREDKSAKQNATTRIIPKTPVIPKRTKRIHFRKRVLDTNSSSESEDSSHSSASSFSTDSV